MADLIETEHDQWFRRLDKELKGQVSERLTQTLIEGIKGNILPFTETAIQSEGIQSSSALKTSELYQSLPRDADLTNANIMQGLSRGVSTIIINPILSQDLSGSILKNVQADLIECHLSHQEKMGITWYRDLETGERSIGLQANDTEHFIESDVHMLTNLITVLEADEELRYIQLLIPLHTRFDLNLMRLSGLRRTLEHFSLATNRSIKIKLHAVYNPGKNDHKLEDRLIAAGAACLAASVSSADNFCIAFNTEYFNNPWPAKYMRALRSLTLLLEHESELLSQRHILEGAHYPESLINQYIQKVWQQLQAKLKSADSL